MLKISEKDKRSLIFLSIFLVLAGYYVLLFEPMLNSWEKQEQVYKKSKKELKLMRMKIREKGSWARDRDRMSSDVANIKSRVTHPPKGKKVEVYVKAIVKSANAAGARVNHIRPIMASDGYSDEIVLSGFAIEGHSDLGRALRFLDSLWGYELEEVSLNPIGKTQGRVKFFYKLSLVTVDRPEKNKKPKRSTFRLKQDLFTAKRPPAPKIKPVVRRAPPKPKPRPKPKLNLSGLSLKGTAEVYGETMAILLDTYKQKTHYLFQGEKIRGFELVAVAEGSANFKNASGTTGKLTMAELTDYRKILREMQIRLAQRRGEAPPTFEDGQSASQPEREYAPVPRRPKLGVKLKMLTPMLARNKNLPFVRGLLVTKKERSDSQIEVGDILTAVNGTRVKSARSLLSVMKKVKPGDVLKVDLVRAGQNSTVNLEAF